MAVAAPLAAVPTPAVIDSLAETYLELWSQVAEAEARAKDLAKPAEDLHERLIELVTAHGGRHAEKSKILHGASYEIVATYSESHSIDDAAVGIFRAEMEKAKKHSLFRQLFDTVLSYSKTLQASEVIRSVKLSDKLRALYAACEISKAKHPSLKVRAK